MNTVAEIEDAVNKLSPAERSELLLRLTEKLRLDGNLQEPGEIPLEEIQEWLEEDARQGREIRKMFGR